MQHACAPLGPRVDSVDCKPLGLPFNISSSLGLHSNKTEKVNMLKACPVGGKYGVQGRN